MLDLFCFFLLIFALLRWHLLSKRVAVVITGLVRISIHLGRSVCCVNVGGFAKSCRPDASVTKPIGGNV